MAKKANEQVTQRPNSQLRVLFVELNGADTTIEEALRTVERMRRPAEVLPQQAKRLANSLGVAEREKIESDAPLFEGREVPTAEAEQSEAQTEQDVPNEKDGQTRPRRGEGPKQDRNAGITPVANLNFVPSGKPALKSFFAEKAAGSDMDRVLVISYYIQHTMELAAHSPGHILAAFRHVGVELPKDLPATIRNMKKKVWLNFTDINSITVATEGLNRVDHEMPKKAT